MDALTLGRSEWNGQWRCDFNPRFPPPLTRTDALTLMSFTCVQPIEMGREGGREGEREGAKIFHIFILCSVGQVNVFVYRARQIFAVVSQRHHLMSCKNSRETPFTGMVFELERVCVQMCVRSSSRDWRLE